MSQKTILALLILFFLPAVAWAEVPLKLGVIDLARIMDQSPQAEAARRELEAEFGPREKALIDKQRRLRDLEERLARDAAILSGSERERLEEQALQLRRELKREQESFREDLNFKRNAALERIQRQVMEVVRAFGKEAGFDLLFADGVIYASERMDVTDQVLERLKKAR